MNDDLSEVNENFGSLKMTALEGLEKAARLADSELWRDQAKALGIAVWELVGRSAYRLVVVFLAVLVISLGPMGWLWLALIDPTGIAWHLFTLFPLVIVLVPLSAYTAFCFAAYRGIADIVEAIGLGRRVSSEFSELLRVAKLDALSLPEFKKKLRSFLKDQHAEAREINKGHWFSAFVGRLVLWVIGCALNFIAKGAMVNGVVDLTKFSDGVGERFDGVLRDYFKRILWDLTRLIIAVVILVMYLLVLVLGPLIGWIVDLISNAM